MDARQLGYFLAVVDHGGFGRAAEQIRIAQPSLSQEAALAAAPDVAQGGFRVPSPGAGGGA